nr:DExH-box ATP-dependent RNA helicase DExH16, mitochondrial [Tanacetum cinerariifolium]
GESFEIWSRRRAQLLSCSTWVTLKETTKEKKTRLEAATKASKNARRRAEVQVEGERKIDFEKDAARHALLKPTNSTSPILLYDIADAIQAGLSSADGVVLCWIKDLLQGCERRAFSFIHALIGIALNEPHLYGDPAVVSLIQRLLSVNGNNLQVQDYERLSPLVALKSLLDVFQTVELAIA